MHSKGLWTYLCAGSAMLVMLCGCASAPPDSSSDYARALVGQWEYDNSKPGCPSTANTAYRANGTLTATYSSCDIESDGFGHFTYGWYVARRHVCFVEIEEQYKDEVKRPKYYREQFNQKVAEGYVEDRCDWRVKGFTARTFTVVTPDGKEIVLERRRWL